MLLRLGFTDDHRRRREEFGRVLAQMSLWHFSRRLVEAIGMTELWIEFRNGIPNRALQYEPIAHLWQIYLSRKPIGDFGDR
ncbi:MAG: hypothetical protein E5Y60_05510 [Mesorhizobium sp.]|nr:MAG: hypothetical protein E5Y60_05510 [Mesorhizobium sp.]